MRGADRAILLVLPMLALAIAFWVLVLGPRSKQAGELEDRAGTLQASIDSSEAQIAQAERARRAFPRNYADLVSLGTAVPEDDDQATLIEDFTKLARQDSVDFRSFKVVPGTGSATAVAPAAAPADAGQPSTSAPASSEATPVAAVPTEATAAALPIGATVGPAGLPVTPYELSYFGGFFDMADLFADLNSSVRARAGGGPPKVHGRLLTVDGFSFEEDPIAGFPSVSADIAVTSYLVPAEQGISAGATPAGPAPVGSPDAPQTVSATAPAASGTTAAVSP